MRFPGDLDNGALRGRAVHSPAEVTAVESDASAGKIFPPQRSDNRTRQLEETWLLLFRELRGPVDSTLLGGLSAGDVAYRLGELVHNYFRTRGVTLTSFELRRIVVELLDNHSHGWPTLKPAPGPNAPPSSLVDFVDGDPDARAIREAAALPPEVATPLAVAPPVIEAIPSPLVSVEPRPVAQASPPSASSRPAENAGPAVAARPSPRREPPRRWPTTDLSLPKETEQLTPEQLVSMEVAAADAAEAVFGAAPPMIESPSVPAELPTAPGATAAATPPPPSPSIANTSDDDFGLGVLEPLLRDAEVTAIMVNGPDAVFVERRGQIGRASGFRDSAHLAAVLERLASFAGKPSSGAARPVVEGRLPDASRFVIVSPPLAPSGPLCTITRRLAPTSTLDDLVGREALSRPMATLLRAAARGRLNILVSGRAESGRTSMLSALARAIAPGERVVTVERRPELRLDLGNVVSLVAPEAGPEMVPAIDLSLAIAAASRLRPDRLVIDGLGNGAVAALVTLIDGGRDGVVASCEANSPRAALEELARRIAESEPQATLATAQKRIVGAFDLVVHLDAFRDGRWRVTHITEVAGADGESVAGHDLFYYDHVSSLPDGRFVGAGRQPSFLPRLAKLGLDEGLVDPA